MIIKDLPKNYDFKYLILEIPESELKEFRMFTNIKNPVHIIGEIEKKLEISPEPFESFFKTRKFFFIPFFFHPLDISNWKVLGDTRWV